MSSAADNTGETPTSITPTPAPTPTPTPNSMAPPAPLAPKRARATSSRKNSSQVWDHFVKSDCEHKDDLTATCSYCGSVLACPTKSGTSCLRNHLNRCKKYPPNVVDKKQKTLIFQQGSGLRDLSSGIAPSTQSSLVSWKYDPDLIREAIAKMIIVDELPFSFVEREGFHNVMNVT